MPGQGDFAKFATTYYMSTTEQSKNELLEVVMNYHLRNRYFITLTHRKPVSIKTQLKNLVRFQLRLSTYSKSHIASLSGSDKTLTQTHAHLILLSENEIPHDLMVKRWDWGKIDVSNLTNKSDEDVRLASFYTMNHPHSDWFQDFCPNPSKCNDLLCLWRNKAR